MSLYGITAEVSRAIDARLPLGLREGCGLVFGAGGPWPGMKAGPTKTEWLSLTLSLATEVGALTARRGATRQAP
ncbi:hypothetical protein AB1Y20_016122 [Prymnesium parvum]|uniref:Uncharacterized protein n=1 Tax=Prymnesium parvum TaxID=97485 RepID=A0AB34K2I4_PRYPA